MNLSSVIVNVGLGLNGLLNPVKFKVSTVALIAGTSFVIKN